MHVCDRKRQTEREREKGGGGGGDRVDLDGAHERGFQYNHSQQNVDRNVEYSLVYFFMQTSDM